MESYYDRLGNIIRDRLQTDDDPFEPFEPQAGRRRQAGNTRERVSRSGKRPQPPRRDVPGSLVADFRTLGVPSGSAPEACKAAWKKLLKEHHPDVHAGNASSETVSNDMTLRINEAYRRITRWFETGDAG